MTQISNKRIAKNAGFLYIRMLALLFISLFTSRIVLEKLGVTDFGIYNVVGGVAALCAFFSTSLSNATERYLNVALGHKDYSLANRIFNQNILLFAGITILIIIISETLIKWWVFDKLDIPSSRYNAAYWVYQFTIITVAANFTGIVYIATIIANESMRIFSYIGILDGVLKLCIALLINASPLDNLITYAGLICLETCLIQFCYAVYCHRNFNECKFKFTYDRKLIKEMFHFVGWNIFGCGIYLTKDTCVNILMNIYYGPIVNAARAVAMQVTTAVGNFTNNVFVAIRPQMMKAYSAQEIDELRLLFFRASKFSLLLFWFICLPVMLCINQLLGLWLTDVPDGAPIFTVWVLIDSMLAILTNPTWSISLASGKIKKYTLFGNGILLIVLPLCLLAFHLGAPPVSAFMVIVFARILQLISVVRIVQPELNYTGSIYIKNIILPAISVIIVSLIITYPLKLWIESLQLHSFLFVLTIGLTSIIVNILIILYIGIQRSERALIFSKLGTRIPLLNKIR